MAIVAKHNDVNFGVGDNVRILQKIKEGKKERTQAFEGMVISIKGRGTGKSITVRRIGAAQVGIERIFPLDTPSLEGVEVVRKGTKGIRRSKLYYTRDKHKREIETIYSREKRKVIIVTKKSKQAS